MKRLTFFTITILIFMLVGVSIAQKGMRIKGKAQSELPGVVYRTGWALLVGINKYPNLPAPHQLNYAVADAVAFAELLRQKFGFPESNITILKDENATKQGILNALSRFADPNQVQDNDCVLVFYSGHGQTVPLPKSRGGGDMGFLVPHDAKVDFSERPNAAQYYRSCIGMDELRRVSMLIPAKHILFIVDACYSGLALQSPRGGGLVPEIPGYLKKIARASVQQMITAGREDEMSVELPDLGHGVFTYKLLEGLEKKIADWNDDGVTTGMELGTYLGNCVPQIAEQTPNFRKEGEGEFLFLPQDGDEQVAVSTIDRSDWESNDSAAADEGESVQMIESIATLIVDSDPKDASVYLDDKLNGTTPCKIKVDVGLEEKCEVMVVVSKDGYLAQRAKVTLIAGKTTKWTDIQLDKSYTQSHDDLNEINQRQDEIIWRKDGAPMVLISAGEFQMGSNDGGSDEKPVHTVYLATFYMDKYEVTNAQYAMFLNDYGRNFDEEEHQFIDLNSRNCQIRKSGRFYFPKKDYEYHPVVEVTWHGAAAYAKFYGKRLPTEAEWEKAARGGLVGKKYPWGDNAPRKPVGNFADETAQKWFNCTGFPGYNDGYVYTAPVGEFVPNGYGLYDMAGNVWEWCSDWYGRDYYKNSLKRNPQGPASGSSRVCRGGSWYNAPIDLRVAFRNRGGMADSLDRLGFRCAILIENQQPLFNIR